MNAELTPIRERAAAIRAQPDHIDQVIGDGAVTARRFATETMGEVKQHMGLV